MFLEQQLVVLCIIGALVFGIRAVLLSSKRMRLLVPAVALLVLAIYELSMNQWEKSVRAPIRLDLFLEIPLIAIFIVWGLLALIFSVQKKT
ncbi:MAG: hypothetical protein DMG73_05460 [Acidobacteria bacterium]|nr:MAG: hypothetical protein DMG73_05460 [Acidobacteriota bacterium]PYX63746.1 MAG: hypothetical protein DMG74_15685 [Acidobacteriota bacterium]